eukprot:TRINITY_DN977_c0_g1_i2.p1 TRINITY_DN977_c0_g1~~TRINITY_DN977_c0_g1_i2.p1  ORF type:complete len:370 (-),score=100.16 TRINITY_DN977_c0_g1_i2:57-1166(-)
MEEKQQQQHQAENQYDLDAYFSNYIGHTKIARLRFFAERCSSEALELEALRMAVDESKKGDNTSVYKEVVEKISGRLGPAYNYDKDWVDLVDKRATQRHEKLEIELNGYKTNLIKESIRMGYNDMGEFHYNRGDLQQFMEVSVELRSNYSDVIAPQDVATYGGLCALASFDRNELKSKVIQNSNFKYFLELVPEVRELIHDFHASRYASCLNYLQKLKPSLMWDIHLHDHVNTLYDQIRHKALIQYTTPFISVNLHTMAAAFNTSVAGIEKELAALIMENQIQARIDSHHRILYAQDADQRNGTFQRSLQMGRQYQRDTRALLLRANLLRSMDSNNTALPSSSPAIQQQQQQEQQQQQQHRTSKQSTRS